MSSVSNDISLPTGALSVAGNSGDERDSSVLKSASKVEGVVTDALKQLTLSDSSDTAKELSSGRPVILERTTIGQAVLDLFSHRCKISGNCKLEDAKIIFIGNTHSDIAHRYIEYAFIERYKDLTGSNYVFEEGVSETGYSQSRREKFPNDESSVVCSWDDREAFLEHGKMYAELRDLLDELNLPKEPNRERTEKRNERINQLTLEFEGKGEDLMRIRDRSLVDKVKACAMSPWNKIFVTAGTQHLVRDGYNVIDFFRDYDYAVVIIRPDE